MMRWLAFSLLLTAALPTAGKGSDDRRDVPKVRNFEVSDPARLDWRIGEGEPQFTRIDASHGESLCVPVSFPGVSEIWRNNIRLVDVSRDHANSAMVLERLRYEVYVPQAAFSGGDPIRIQARLLLKNKDGIWFEALGRRLDGESAGWAPATALYPGWNIIEIDLSEQGADCRPCGHSMAWSRFLLSQITSLGIALQGDRPWQGALAIDNIATWPARDDSFPPLRIVDFMAPTAVSQYGLAEMSFNVNRPILNPFSAREIVIDAEFISPEGGETVIIPAFYWQDYEYHPVEDVLADGYAERLIGKGPACFKVRFTPRRPGKWTYTLRVSYCSPINPRAAETITTPPRLLEVSPRAGRGFVRIAGPDGDSRFFAFENGEPLFLIGHSLRSPTDPRHVEAVLRPYFTDIRPKDVQDWAKLCAGLAAEDKSELLSRLCRELSPETLAFFRQASEAPSLDETQQMQVLAYLNGLIRRRGIFAHGDWLPLAGIEEVRMWLYPRPQSPRHHNEEPRLHRIILETQIPGGLRPTWTADRGLRAYEEILPRMQAAGVNCFELWMCSWWVADEWTRRWKGYHGLGVYNLENMWRLDRLLEMAEHHDQYIHLVIDNHGKAAQKSLIPGQQDQCDHEFENSPYNIANREDGGFLRQAVELFSDERAKEYYRQRYRYLAGRFGWCTRIYGWELWSELDLIGQPLGRHRHIYEAPAVRDWHREMAAWLKRWDQGKRPITTHYSGDYTWIDRGMIAQHGIEYIVCDAYHNPNQRLLDMLAATENLALPYGKPFMITEFGGDWNASSAEGLLGDLYAGLWWGWISRSAGTPLYWWFELISQEDLYTAYRALARYVAGEDKRRKPGQSPLHDNWPLRFESEAGPLPNLRALILGDGDVFYVWCYDQAQIHYLPRQEAQRQSYRGVQAVLNVGQPSAEFHVEFWNSWKGECEMAQRLAADENGEIRMALPEFAVHTALKIKRPHLLPVAGANAESPGRSADMPGE